MRVAVVGAGIYGLSVAWGLRYLSRLYPQLMGSVRVSLFELSSSIPNTDASSCDDHRLIRHPYGEHLGYMQMVDDAYDAWGRVWKDIGRVHYAPRDTLVLTSKGSEWARVSRQALEHARFSVKDVSREWLSEHLPILHTDDLDGGYIAPTGGILFARNICKGLGDFLSKDPLVQVHRNTRVEDISCGGHGVRLSDGRSFEHYDHVVVCAGPWVHHLAPSLKNQLFLARQILAYFQAPDRSALQNACRKSPVLLDIQGDCPVYMVPPTTDPGSDTHISEFKIGLHDTREQGGAVFPIDAIDPSSKRQVEPDELEWFLDVVRRRMPGIADCKITRNITCYYTVSRDNERFLCERPLSDLCASRCTILTGFSGHGFKFAPAIGLRVAETLFHESGRLDRPLVWSSLGERLHPNDMKFDELHAWIAGFRSSFPN